MSIRIIECRGAGRMDGALGATMCRNCWQAALTPPKPRPLVELQMVRGVEFLRGGVTLPGAGVGSGGGGGGGAVAIAQADPSRWVWDLGSGCGSGSEPCSAAAAAAGCGPAALATAAAAVAHAATAVAAASRGGSGDREGVGRVVYPGSRGGYGRGGRARAARASGGPAGGGGDGGGGGGDEDEGGSEGRPAWTPVEGPSGERQEGKEGEAPSTSTSGSEGSDEPPPSLGVRAALSALAFYRGVLSPLMPSTCRFLPSCSVYSIESYKKFGVARGSVLTAWRLLRCNPWGGRGYDPPSWPPVGLGAVYRYPYTPEISVVLMLAAAYWLVASTIESLS
ncbi:hypothetical protein PLESTB_000398200 [Pleodorina starrii]|uniref:Membrane protein insertion efficiency factor n=1 Tax=Pleodorina starrii TaxID=330485 RepID=A0A9W6BFF7_9CHLO|nr:hypothetical protein PLESTM_001494100 [Pleodorina starrii]GLC50602.1 hypothetical protein PLESTB_000398200 [Pleodorina starrii]